MILGTAGHIDHGKTSLVRALTGVDTDRLPEEKRRGITIELGFAPLHLDGVGTLGVVDVPGHEGFVRTMLAGATGVDLALLVVAADEGMMPQTREHLAILSLLGVQGGVIALTKRDLVDDDWLALVRDDVRDAVAGSALEQAPVIAVSAATGIGLAELREALATAALRVPAREDADLFRLPVDRSFTVKGTGTVVTGTVWSGTVARDATVRILPSDRTARIRGIQQHGAPSDAASPGSRVALALAGVDVGDVPRGSVIVGDASWRNTLTVRALVQLLPDAASALRPRTRVRFHLGTNDVGARIVALGGVIEPGDTAGARLILDEPVVARAGDRFVIRGGSPVVTLGGGVVVDPAPPSRRARPWPDAPTPDVALSRMIEEGGGAGVERAVLPVRLGLTPARVTALLRACSEQLVSLGGFLYALPVVRAMQDALERLVEVHHERHPLEPGAPMQTLRAALGARPELAADVVARAVADGRLESVGGYLRARGWSPSPLPAHRPLLERLARTLREAGREPPSSAELQGDLGPDTLALLHFLERSGSLVQVESDRFYDAGALEALVTVLRSGMVSGREYGPGDLRELLGVSRKYLIPLLEYCDRRGITDRSSGGRTLRGT